jgi:hypothetical protein
MIALDVVRPIRYASAAFLRRLRSGQEAGQPSGPHSLPSDLVQDQRINFWKACRPEKLSPSALMISLVEPCQRYRRNPKIMVSVEWSIQNGDAPVMA